MYTTYSYFSKCSPWTSPQQNMWTFAIIRLDTHYINRMQYIKKKHFIGRQLYTLGIKEEIMWSILTYEQMSRVKSCTADNDMHAHSSHTTFFSWYTYRWPCYISYICWCAVCFILIFARLYQQTCLFCCQFWKLSYCQPLAMSDHCKLLPVDYCVILTEKNTTVQI